MRYKVSLHKKTLFPFVTFSHCVPFSFLISIVFLLVRRNRSAISCALVARSSHTRSHCIPGYLLVNWQALLRTAPTALNFYLRSFLRHFSLCLKKALRSPFLVPRHYTHALLRLGASRTTGLCTPARACRLKRLKKTALPLLLLTHQIIANTAGLP